MAVFAALAAGFGGTLAVIGEVALALPRAAAAVAVFATLAARFGGAFAIVGEVAGVMLRAAAAAAMLAALAPRFGRALTIIGEITGIIGSHVVFTPLALVVRRHGFAAHVTKKPMSQTEVCRFTPSCFEQALSRRRDLRFFIPL
jgi:flagellar motor component MotA